MFTVGETISKISELKSRKAILNELLVYLETHYKSSDAGPAEIKIQTSERAIVPEDHIDVEIANLTHQMDHISQELKQWEKLVVVGPDEDPPKKVQRKRKSRAAKGQHSNQSAPRDSKQEGD